MSMINKSSALRQVTYQGRCFRLFELEKLYPGGNKHFKLTSNLAQARALGVNTVVSFGGAWSNHIHALAQLGAQQKLTTIGIIRGERPAVLSSMLVDAENFGMTLRFVSRSMYRQLTDDFAAGSLLRTAEGSLYRTAEGSLSAEGSLYRTVEGSSVFAGVLGEDLVGAGAGGFYCLPEGGTNQLAVKGCVEIVTELDRHIAAQPINDSENQAYDLICLPVGTGGTLAGVSAALAEGKSVLGICVLKKAQYLDARVGQMLAGLSGREAQMNIQQPNWKIEHGYHCGGYAKTPDYLKRFILEFEDQNGISLDPVYTAKMVYGLVQMLLAGDLQSNASVVAIHTGGMQGRRGFDF
ncbi:MAG: pyridoxal-phosphate dependent enzyme [Pseudomonadales bacterium]|nr:pyridoxal-phosphate dependent enzyme [Pseudomonadales bacterium]